MVSIILVDNGSSSENISEWISELSSLSEVSLTVLAGKPTGTSLANYTFVPISDGSLSKTLKNIAPTLNNNLCILINGRSSPSTGCGTQLLSLLNIQNYSFAVLPIMLEEHTSEVSKITSESLVRLFNTDDEFPSAALAFDRSLLENLSDTEAGSFEQIFLELIILAVSEEHTFVPLGADSELSLPIMRTEDVNLSNSTRAWAIQKAVSLCNIEDLFPDHAWDSHEDESLSASYHALAATFVRLGALDSALECISLSEQLEDSPRSLALKGFIASLKGQTLEAVADLVSSLQVYEKRKTNDGTHYLTFVPEDFALINDELRAGLEALNNQNSIKAFECFQRAIASFDSFFRDFKIL